MNTVEIIDKYLDNELPQEQARQLERELRIDPALREVFDSVKIAREAVRSRALRSRIHGLHARHITELREEPAPPPADNVVPLHRRQPAAWGLRIAAGLLLLLLGYGGYQYATLDAGRLYDEKFTAYQLPTARGDAPAPTRLDALYESGQYAAVTRAFARLPDRQPRDYFLAGVAHLQLRQFNRAAALFASLRQRNAQRGTGHFAQETDYYLALAYLGAGQTEKAYALFKKIHDSPQHLYHPLVTDRDLLKLNVLDFKD